MCDERKEVKAAGLPPDGLRYGSVGAAMVDLALREQAVTLHELAQTTKAKNPLPLLRRACRQGGVKLTYCRAGRGAVQGRYFAS